VEETLVPGENHRSAAWHWQTLSHNVVLSTPHQKRKFVDGTDDEVTTKKKKTIDLTTVSKYRL
jgi:hypothetical protein